MKVVCFGDSNTYGYDPRSFFGDRYSGDSRWVDLLAEKTHWHVINQGENGRRIPMKPVSFPADTDLLIVMLGTNDLLQSNHAAQTAQGMYLFLSALPLEKEKILLIAPPPLVRGAWVADQTLMDHSKSLSQLYRKLAEDLCIRFADAGAWHVSLAFDGVHFTEKGHQDFAYGLLNSLISFGFI